MVTAGNASGINDGAAAVVVMSAARARELGVKPRLRLVARAEAGEEIVIARGGTPVAKLVPLAPPPAGPKRSFGRLRGLGSVGDEALEGWTEEELREWEAEDPDGPARGAAAGRPDEPPR